MITHIYRPKFRMIFLSISLFAFMHSNAFAISQIRDSNPALSDSKSTEVIYLAQSSDEEELKKKILLEGEAEEEEEEPDCD